MKDSYKSYAIASNDKVAKDIYKLSVEGKFQAAPGEFFMLRRDEKNSSLILARPLSVHMVEEDHIDFLYVVVGKGTEGFKRLNPGDRISLLGPLGKGFDIEELNSYKKLALVSGGIGNAPLEYLAYKLDTDFDVLGGYRGEVYMSEYMSKKATNTYITTEDGSSGTQGLVTQVLDESKYDKIVACGPEPMLKALYEMLDDKDKLIVSMEARMACGIGACLGCTCGEPSIEPRRVCLEGPVFKGEEVYGN